MHGMVGWASCQAQRLLAHPPYQVLLVGGYTFLYASLYTPWVHHHPVHLLPGYMLHAPQRVQAQRALGSEGRNTLGRTTSSLFGAKKCEGWYTSLRRVTPLFLEGFDKDRIDEGGS